MPATATNRMFSMNMMQPKVKRKFGCDKLYRSWVHETQTGENIDSFTGTSDGKGGGAITCAMIDPTLIGEHIEIPLFFGFSFAKENPGLAGEKNTKSVSSGWYHYAKLEWWTGSSEILNPSTVPPTTANTKTAMTYEVFSYTRGTYPGGSIDWRFWRIMMNAATWVCIGTETTIFATGKMVGGSSSSGGGDSGGGDIPTNPGPIDLSIKQVWYGRVNTWASASQQLLDQEVAAMVAAGVKGYIIEMGGWASYDVWTPAWLATTKARYSYLLNLCRTNNLTLFAAIVNDNMGSGKYGDLGTLTLDDVISQARDLCQYIKSCGSESVIIQPVSESYTSAGHNFEDYCTAQLTGFTLVYNGTANGDKNTRGRPNTIPAGFNYRAWHPFYVTDSCPADALVISDTGNIIKQLGNITNQTILYGAGKPAAIQAWVRARHAQGVKVVGYYAFSYDQLDLGAINALGAAMT